MADTVILVQPPRLRTRSSGQPSDKDMTPRSVTSTCFIGGPALCILQPRYTPAHDIRTLKRTVVSLSSQTLNSNPPPKHSGGPPPRSCNTLTSHTTTTTSQTPTFNQNKTKQPPPAPTQNKGSSTSITLTMHFCEQQEQVSKRGEERGGRGENGVSGRGRGRDLSWEGVKVRDIPDFLGRGVASGGTPAP